MKNQTSDYIGHPSQIHRVEEHRLVGGRGDGMRLVQVANGCGLDATVSADRAGDLARVSFCGMNLGFFAPCGYVAPQYYDPCGTGFLRSFTAAFLTTCGLTAVGTPCTDDGEALPLHGTIANTPAESLHYEDDGREIRVRLVMRDAALFAHRLVLTRTYTFPLDRNRILLHDAVQNVGAHDAPYMILYHFNMGYPLLTARAELTVPACETTPRNARAAEGLHDALRMIPPQPQFEEQCYYHTLTDGCVSLRDPDSGVYVRLRFDRTELPYFTQWKLMERGSYVLGLEPGNCTPDGRDVLRRAGRLRFLAPGETAEQTIEIEIGKDR